MQFARGELNPQNAGRRKSAAGIDDHGNRRGYRRHEARSDGAPDAHAKWAFSKPVAPAVPPVIERWLDSQPGRLVCAVAPRGERARPAPPANKRALLRRVYFDLIGLPPTLEEANAFVYDESPDAYEKLVDKLLSDKRYGERWGRHWLDLVRFAESDGFAIDGERPTAWRYRDYVIRAFNSDKPYEVFVQEQLAGDEMERRRPPRGILDSSSEAPIALGYLRMGPWEADANFDDQLRLDWLNEITGTTSQVFLGLTAGCARCHDHKYDPIPQRDFYRMQAFFASTRIDDRPAPFLEAEDRARMRRLLRQYEDDLDTLNQQLHTTEEVLRTKFAASSKDPSAFESALADPKNGAFTAEERKSFNDLQERVRRITADMQRYRPVAYSVNEVVPPAVLEIAPTYVLSGGELAAKGDKVEPGFPRCLVGKEEPAKMPFSGRYRSGRRRALAEWIASPDNPLTARVMVNRIWQHHFGEGLVRTPCDFGMNGDRPSHPELLDWLATQFVEKKWSVKAMHRLMLTSNAYRQSTGHPGTEKIRRSRSRQSAAVADELDSPRIRGGSRFHPVDQRQAEYRSRRSRHVLQCRRTRSRRDFSCSSGFRPTRHSSAGGPFTLSSGAR